MQTRLLVPAVLTLLCLGLLSCTKTDLQPNDPAELSEEVIAKINQLGFSADGAFWDEDAYVVEGDIRLTPADLDRAHPHSLLRIANTEQYHTTNLVAVSGARTITVSMRTGLLGLPAAYGAALDEAIARYNAEGLSISFQRVSSGGDINIRRGLGNYLASAGFPTAAGDPHNQVLVNPLFIGFNPDVDYVATILAHEIGHCIGFRHTDYMDRSYSCGGTPTNEGASTVGAIHIPGTPTDPDDGSWMLSCIASGEDRPFNANDRTALDYLY